MSISAITSPELVVHGEGPHWDEKTQSLLFIDTFEGNFHQLNTITGENKMLHFGELKVLSLNE